MKKWVYRRPTYAQATKSLRAVLYPTDADHTITFQGDPPDGNGEVTLAGKVPTVHWTVTPVKGTATLTGKVPALDLAIESGREELSLTGKTPTVHWTITSDREELDLTGKTPTVHWTITSDREELALTGKVPRLALGIAVGKGSLSVTGKVPTLHYTIIYDEAIDSVEIIEKTPILAYAIRDPPVEELDLQGKAPTVHWTITSPREQLDLSGKVPTVHWTVSPAKGTATLTGKVPEADNSGDVSYTVEVPYTFLRLKSLVGLWLQGYSPVISTGGDVTIPGTELLPEELDLTGKVPVLALSSRPGRDELDLAGKVPTLGLTLSPARDELDLTGKVPIIGKVREPDRYELSLAGKVPTLGLTLSPARDELDLTGKVPIIGKVREPDRYELGLTGKTPTLDLSFTPGRDELDLTGKTPTLDLSFTPARGELDLTGKVPVLDLTVSPARYQLSLAGKTPLLPLIVGKGSLSLTGYEPAIDAIQPAKGTLTLTGKVPTVHWSITPAKGELDLTGKVSTVHWTATPGRDELDLTGKVPTVHWTVTPGRDELDLTGKVSTVHWSITPTEGDLTLSGKQATVHWSVTPGRLELSLTGYEITLGAFLPDAGELDLTGKAPELVNSGAPTVSVPYSFLTLYSRRGLWLNGIAPTILVSEGKITVGEATLGLSGKVPTLDYSWTVKPVKSGLLLTGYAPVSTAVEEIGNAALALAGKAPAVKRGPPVIIEVGRKQLSLNGYITTRAYGLLLTGFEPYLETEGVRAPDTVDLTLSTYAPEVDNTTVPPIEIPVPEGQQLGLQGYWPVLGIINPNQESTFVLEGWEPLAEASSPTFFPGRCSLDLAEIAPISDVEGLAPTAYLSLAGQQPNTVARTVIPGAESLNLTGTVPLEGPEPPAALLSLTGLNVYTRRTVSPDTGAVTLSSDAPTVREGINTYIIPDAGSLALSGKAPVTNIGPAPLVAAGNLVLSGQVPIADRTVSVGVDSSELQLTGYVPVLFQDHPVDTPKGTLAIDEKTFKYKIKRIRKTGARKRLRSLTVKYEIEILYR